MYDKVMDNSLDLYYLNYNKPNNSSSSSSSSSMSSSSMSSSSEKTNTSINKNSKNSKNTKNTKNKEIDENISTLTNYNYNSMFQSNLYSDFKEKVREILIKEYEIPVYEALIRIKERRLDKEYEEGLKRHYDELMKLKKDTEKSMFQIRQYLDYIEANNESNNKFLPYLFGFESRYKMGEVIIPDILGFTKKNRPELKEKYMDFIFILVTQFLGNLGYLYLSIKKLKDYLPKKIEELINNEDMSLDLCKYYNENSEMKALKNINNYYNLLSDIIDNGKFNINKFLSDSTTKKEDILKKGGAPAAKKKQPSFPTLSPTSFSKLFGIKSKTKSYLSEDNKKGDSYDKKVKYILKYESLSLKDQKKVNINNYDLLKIELKEGGKKIFIGKLEKDLKTLKSKINPSLDISKVIDEITNKTSTNYVKDREYFDDVLREIKYLNPPGKFTKIVELCEPDSSLSYRDFYTGNEITSSDVLTSEERNYKYYFGIRKLFKLIDKYYINYSIKNLPLSSDSKTEQKKIGLNILKGIGNYSSIIRVFLNESLIKIYNNDVLVRERNKNNKIKSNLKLKENQIKNLKPQNQIKNLKSQNQNLKSQNIKSQNIKSQNIKSQNQKSQNIKSQNQNQNQNLKSQNILLKQKLNKINKEILKVKNNIVKKKLSQLKNKIITKITKKI
jgi:hypothetical protein